MWARLVVEAEQLRLPTKFLKVLPPEFVTVEFDDLRTYAAEYHPGEHRLILNRTLSFNAAGGVLKPLARLTHKEIEVLYHELFHAYMDYLQFTSAMGGESSQLLTFARKQQGCRYGEVSITPVVQRPSDTELRYLTARESWEALNETWAVFIGWVVWSQLHVEQADSRPMVQDQRQLNRWAERLDDAFQNGNFRGYYVPEDPDERRVTHKRILAKQSQLTWIEASVLMVQALGFPPKVVQWLEQRPGHARSVSPDSGCDLAPG